MERLIEVIEHTVWPNSWSDVGGPGTILPGVNPGTLDILQTWRVHAHITALLDELKPSLTK
jgi:hypothetical protein